MTKISCIGKSNTRPLSQVYVIHFRSSLLRYCFFFMKETISVMCNSCIAYFTLHERFPAKKFQFWRTSGNIAQFSAISNDIFLQLFYLTLFKHLLLSKRAKYYENFSKLFCFWKAGALFVSRHACIERKQKGAILSISFWPGIYKWLNPVQNDDIRSQTYFELELFQLFSFSLDHYRILLWMYFLSFQ